MLHLNSLHSREASENQNTLSTNKLVPVVVSLKSPLPTHTLWHLAENESNSSSMNTHSPLQDERHPSPAHHKARKPTTGVTRMPQT